MDINISPRGQKGIPLPLPNIGENYIPVPEATVLDYVKERTWYAHTGNAHTWYTLKVPIFCEIFYPLDFRDFYTIKPFGYVSLGLKYKSIIKIFGEIGII